LTSSDQVRAEALALPEVVELDHHGIPSFRLAGKIFCTLRVDGPPRMMVKLTPEHQYNFVEAHPDIITAVPGYWGRKGSTFVDLAKVERALAVTLLEIAWAGVGPKRLSGRP
jgi:hypothetical protein